MEIVQNLSKAIEHPFSITVCEDSLKTVLIFLLAYGMGIGIYLSTRRNYRRREEHGSAKWGDAGAVNKKYRDKDLSANKLLTQNVRIGLDGKKHRRNLNILVCGGSGAGKTEEQNFPMVMELLRAGEVREDDDSYVSPLDELFDRLEMVNPEHIALKYYRDYHSGSAKTLNHATGTMPQTAKIRLACRLSFFRFQSRAFFGSFRLVTFRGKKAAFTLKRFCRNLGCAFRTVRLALYCISGTTAKQRCQNKQYRKYLSSHKNRPPLQLHYTENQRSSQR